MGRLKKEEANEVDWRPHKQVGKKSGYKKSIPIKQVYLYMYIYNIYDLQILGTHSLKSLYMMAISQLLNVESFLFAGLAIFLRAWGRNLSSRILSSEDDKQYFKNYLVHF